VPNEALILEKRAFFGITHPLLHLSDETLVSAGVIPALIRFSVPDPPGLFPLLRVQAGLNHLPEGGRRDSSEAHAVAG
jgi:hypothetical protein